MRVTKLGGLHSSHSEQSRALNSVLCKVCRVRIPQPLPESSRTALWEQPRAPDIPALSRDLKGPQSIGQKHQECRLKAEEGGGVPSSCCGNGFVFTEHLAR